MAANQAIGADDLLLIIDPQYDFCPGGGLAVEEGDLVMPLINRIAEKFQHIVVTQDWHPAGHSSFASSHPGKAPFETITLDYGEQTLWPDHCIQGTSGAAFHEDLDMTGAEMVVRKGFRQAIDSYSAFYENDRRTPTGLAGYLRERGFQRVVCVGLALDYCVRYSAEDAVRCGFGAVVVEDATRPVNLFGSLEAAHESFRQMGVEIIQSSALVG